MFDFPTVGQAPQPRPATFCHVLGLTVAGSRVWVFFFWGGGGVRVQGFRA